MIKRIIDNRKKEKFMLDDAYLNGQAKLCGWQGTLVYMSLCRHANKEQESFPSIKLMAEQHNVGRDTILKGIKNLEKRNLIQVGKKRTKSGQWLNNSYTLIDKLEWKYSQVGENDTASQVGVSGIPSRCERLDQVGVNDTKETHSEGNTSKETHTSEHSSQVNKILDEFYEINPTLNYGNTTQRKAVEEMIKRWGEDNLVAMVRKYKENINERFMPVATSPLAFKNKVGDIKVAIDKLESNPLITNV